MAFPQDSDMPKSMDVEGKRFISADYDPDALNTSHFFYPNVECENFQKWCAGMLESGKNVFRRFTKNAGGPKLYNTFVADCFTLSISFQSDQDLFDWCSETVHSFDRKTKIEGSTQDYVQQFLEDSPAALICHHREGSFNLSPETVACCLRVAYAISVSCFLYCLRIGTFEDQNGSVLDKSDLMNALSKLLDKWQWGGDECKNTINDWITYIEQGADDSEKEEAMKLLYQWTRAPLVTVLGCVGRELFGASWENYDEVDRASERGDEVCHFLEDDYGGLFTSSDKVEFLYETKRRYFSGTATLLSKRGNRDRAVKLLGKLTKMFDDVKNRELLVTKYGHDTIEYFELDRIELGEWPYDLESTTISRISDPPLKIGVELHRTHTQDYGISTWERQAAEIIASIEKEWYSKAKEIFMQIDLKPQRVRAQFPKFLESLTKLGTSSLDSLCERQELLLDVSEALLVDRELTANFLQQYANMICMRSKRNFQEFMRRKVTGSSPRASVTYVRLAQWLEKELNLQLTLPEPGCIQEVISCLRDPCCKSEHRRENLPDTLKIYRLWKSSFDIFSELIRNWVNRGTASEVKWLAVLESHKSVHDSILSFLFNMCSGIDEILERSSSSVKADNGLFKDSEGSSESNLLVYRALVGALLTSGLVWTERGRAQTLMFQLGPRDNTGSFNEELIKFYKDEQAALSTIQSGMSACKAKTLFIEYVTTIDGAEKSSDQTYSDTPPRAFITDEQNQEIGGTVMFNSSCADDGPFDKQLTVLLDEFYKMVEKFCNTRPLPRRLDESVVGDLHRILEKLYDLLIEPFSGNPMFTRLDPKATIVFVPDKILYRVPFALLRDKRTQKYLFQRHPIAISPSLRVLRHCERQLRELEKSPLKPDGCILAVGDAAYETNRLPGTRKELECLHSSFPGRVQTLEQEQATRANFLKLIQEASCSEEKHVFAFIHLAVHGHWSKTDPRNKNEEGNEHKTGSSGSLQFAKLPDHPRQSCERPTTDLYSRDGGTPQSRTAELDEKDKIKAKSASFGEIRQARAFGEVGAVTRRPDGYRSSAAGDMLPSEDIINGGFQWRTRLVVLSACNSLRGQAYSDGEVNLPRALMIAGVPAAVVSQWKVSDVGSPRLMKALYEHLQHGQDVATALQSAMLQLSSDSDSESANNIFEWGPFLVWGLPTVQLPKEMLTANARKVLLAKQRAGSLRYKFNRVQPEATKLKLLNLLKAVDNAFEAVYTEFALKDEVILSAILDAVLSVQSLLDLSHHPYLYEDSIQLVEDFFTLLPFERLQKIELELINRTDRCYVYDFRNFIMCTQAMKGNYEIALTYANRMLKSCEVHGSITKTSQIWLLNRAVIFTLMEKYKEALESFHAALDANGENMYACLIQTSYLKYLMADKSGALEYALQAKKYENADVRKPGFGAFTLSYKALPNEYREWLLNVVDSTGALSSSIWDSLTIPKEPTRTKKVNQQIEKLRLKCSIAVDDTKELKMLQEALNVVDDFLASEYNECVLVQEVIVSSVIAMEQLLKLDRHPLFYEELIALGEEFYSVYIHKHSTSIELALVKEDPMFFWNCPVRFRLIYTLAMKGSYQAALEYANKMTEYMSQNAERRGGYDEDRPMQDRSDLKGLLRQERAVVLRLMGRYDEALKQFEDELDFGEDYDCLIETSYLKHRMGDEKGAQEYALRAKTVEGDYLKQKDQPGYGAFVLGTRTIPDEYRRWLSKVDAGNHERNTVDVSAIIRGLSNVQLPKEVGSENARTARLAEQQAENLLSSQSNRTEDDNVKLGVKILLRLEPLLKRAWASGQCSTETWPEF